MLELNFPDLIRQARSGDEAAWAELVRRFEPFIQRVARIRMRARGDFEVVRRDAGSSDVCQSVFKSFFQGLRENRYRLNGPDDLEKLLHGMVRFNVATRGRRAWVRLRKLLEECVEEGWIDPGPGPEEEVVRQEFIEAIQQHFTENELEILTFRLDDTPWEQVAEKLNCTEAAARQRLTRAMRRVRNKLNTGDRAET